MRRIGEVTVGLFVVCALCGFSFPVVPTFFTHFKLQPIQWKWVPSTHLLTIQMEQSTKLLVSSV